ncbi:MAG: nucleotidyltransferase domain-containing protein [Deltaproteobacteria bacterium]
MWRQQLRDRLIQQPDVIAAYLFGSQARGTANEHSDIDVGIWLGSTPKRFEDAPFGLAGELEALLGMRVDVVVMNGASPDLVHRILRDGELIVELDRSRRISLEVHARNQYFDTQHLRTSYRLAAGRK